jgi:WD40 repeat protein/anti-sigma factor RsiW
VRQLLSDLLAGVLEPEPADALDAHLAGCCRCREQARSYVRLHRALGELAARARQEATLARIRAVLAEDAAAAAARSTGPARAPRSRRPLRWVLGLAAGLLLVAVGLYLWQQAGTAVPAIAQLAQVRGEVYLLAGGAQVAVEEGQAVLDGLGLKTVGEESRAVVLYPDGTRLEVGPDTTIGELRDSNQGEAGKRVVLVDGFFAADVSPQPAGRPMVLVTPHAQVVVHGTRLNVANLSEATWVELEQGAVTCTRRSDGQSVELAEGSLLVVRPADEPLPPPLPLPPRLTRPRTTLPEGSGRVLGLTFTADGRQLITGGRLGQVKLWNVDADADQEPLILYEHPSEVRSLALAPNGRLLVTGSDDGDRNQLRRFDLVRRQELPPPLRGHRSWIESLAFFRDSRALIVAGAHGSDGARVRWWDMESGQILATTPGHAGGTWAAVLSPDQQTLATGGRDGFIRIWDVPSRQLKDILTGHGHEVTSLSFSPDGKTLASASKDKTAKLWDLDTGDELVTLVGHSYDLRSIAFSPDGRTLATGSTDGTVKLWDMNDYRERATLKGHGGGVWCTVFSPDGKTLAVGGSFRSVKLWDMEPMSRD